MNTTSSDSTTSPRREATAPSTGETAVQTTCPNLPCSRRLTVLPSPLLRNQSSWTLCAASSHCPCCPRARWSLFPLYRILAMFEILSSKVSVTRCSVTLEVCCVAHESSPASTRSFSQDLLFRGRTAVLGSHQ